jgi:hypothetical protein
MFPRIIILITIIDHIITIIMKDLIITITIDHTIMKEIITTIEEWISGVEEWIIEAEV